MHWGGGFWAPIVPRRAAGGRHHHALCCLEQWGGETWSSPRWRDRVHECQGRQGTKILGAARRRSVQAKFIVVAVETGGRWSPEALEFVEGLARPARWRLHPTRRGRPFWRGRGDGIGCCPSLAQKRSPLLCCSGAGRCTPWVGMMGMFLMPLTCTEKREEFVVGRFFVPFWTEWFAFHSSRRVEKSKITEHCWCFATQFPKPLRRDWSISIAMSSTRPVWDYLVLVFRCSGVQDSGGRCQNRAFLPPGGWARGCAEVVLGGKGRGGGREWRCPKRPLIRSKRRFTSTFKGTFGNEWMRLSWIIWRIIFENMHRKFGIEFEWILIYIRCC